MIFVGDIAIPFANAIKFKDFPEELKSLQWFGNLEGTLISDINPKSNGVFNNHEAIKNLITEFDFAGFALANNHIFDYSSPFRTVEKLKQLNVPYCGIGKNEYEASDELILNVGKYKIIIINFGWEVIQCKTASENKPGVNPLRRDHVLRCINKLTDQYKNAYIIPFMHWSYELEGEPQPFERELAKKMIEAGASGVIGCHPHRVGGFEMYNGKPIIYSLGNWLFMQNYYHSGRLSFPDFCNKQLAFEWNFLTGEMLFHFFLYNKKKSLLEYQYTEDINSPTMKKLTPFEGLSNEEYKIWYKKNHYHKNKGLPIYFYEDSELTIKMKNGINKLRDFGVGLIRGVRK